MILLTGATGRTGRPLVDRVVEEGIPARALVRDASKADALRDRGLEVVVGDLSDHAAVQRAMDGIERALLLAANSPDQWEQERGFIEAAAAAGVGHVVKVSAIGADPGSKRVLKRFHGRAEDLLRDSAIAHTIVQGNFYMDNLLTQAPLVAKERMFALPMGRGRVGPIDVRDVADALFATLTQPGFENRSFLVTGPEVLSFGDMADRLGKVLGRAIRYVDLPPDVFREQLMSVGVPTWNVDAMLELFALIRDDRNACVTEDFTALTGKAPRTFDEWARDHAGNFR